MVLLNVTINNSRESLNVLLILEPVAGGRFVGETPKNRYDDRINN